MTLRLLQAAPRFAVAPTSGAELRNHYLARHLSRHMHVTHVGFVPPGSGLTSKQDADGPCWIPVPRHGSYRPLDLVRGVVGGTPFSVLNYTRVEMSDALRQLLSGEHFDIVQLESIHLAGYLPVIRGAAHPPRTIVCDWHNIESEILRRYAETTGSLPRRLYARLAAGKLEGYERQFVRQCDLHIAVSERDAAALRASGAERVAVIENGVEAAYFAAIGAAEKRYRVLFVGAMDYHANIDGTLFFAREVWPQLARRLPDLVFTIAGRNPAPEVLALAGEPRIEVTGTVADVRPYYREAWIAVAPLRVGGGTRLKILEAMAAGVPVVSTTLGAEGLAVEPGRDCLVADTAAATAEAIVELAADSERYAAIAQAGRQLVLQRYDWPALGDELAFRLVEAAGQ